MTHADATGADVMPTPLTASIAPAASNCELCDSDGGLPIARMQQFRVIRVADRDYPGFYRVIWNAHVAEFSDLSADERRACMDAVAVVEQLMRQHLRPTKVNLASLGNMVPHLHWHVIARFETDRHFPQPVWATASRPAGGEPATAQLALQALDKAIAAALLTS